MGCVDGRHLVVSVSKRVMRLDETGRADSLIVVSKVIIWMRYRVSMGALEILCQRLLFSAEYTVLAALPLIFGLH